MHEIEVIGLSFQGEGRYDLLLALTALAYQLNSCYDLSKARDFIIFFCFYLKPLGVLLPFQNVPLIPLLLLLVSQIPSFAVFRTD